MTIRRTGAAIAFAVIVALMVPAPAHAAPGAPISPSAGAQSAQVADVVALLNQQRSANSVAPLRSDPRLDDVAQAWAAHLAATSTFEHSSSAWRSGAAGQAGWIWGTGENIAAGYTSAGSVMNGWMASAGHRANILSASYGAVGVGYAQGGSYGHYWVQVFATKGPGMQTGTAPVISGSAASGSPLTASTTGWSANASLAWRWIVDGRPVAGVTGPTFAPTIAEVGKRIVVELRASEWQLMPETRYSSATAVVTGARPTTERVSGADRFETAAALAVAAATAPISVAIVVNGLNYPDALAASPAAVASDGALLLVTPTTVPPATLDALHDLAPASIIIVGGPDSVGNGVAEQLSSIAPTTRIAGSDRFETSNLLARAVFDAPSVVYLASGANYPDALSAGAAAGEVGAPVVLVNGALTRADEATLALLAALQPNEIRIAGGHPSVSAGFESSLSTAGYAVVRYGGADRYETAALLNAAAFGTVPRVYLTSGENYPDALVAAAVAGAEGVPVMISPPSCMTPSVLQALMTHGPSLVTLVGGTPSLTPAVAAFTRC